MKLNVAAGDLVEPGMVNVDLRPTGQVVADAAALPFRDGAFDHVQALDILEHFPRDRTGPVLDEWHRVTCADGWLTIKTPNMAALARAILDDLDSTDLYVRNVYGGHRWGPDGAWDTHHWGWTPATIERDLDAHGFEVESNDYQINMTVEAVKA